MKFLIENKNVKYIIYFENLENDELKGVELFLIDDEFLVYGIYCNTKYSYQRKNVGLCLW